ncbi:Hypothetical predicted protein [Olea europaea subsp. europaea]|uniref:Uncharacterized protein n=1 Tax=Olea europaea subsp. europaea TaxID=158383 RepID=A0A8S0QDI0_OLEEU|nr:Hypothetical predicted protein [Olea europaea subsp. europaea]
MSIDTTYDMHSVSKNSYPLQSGTNSSEVLQMSPWERRYGSENLTPPYSADTNFESTHDMHIKNPSPPYSADANFESMQNTPQMNNLNLHLRTKENLFHSVSSSSDHSDLMSFQSSNTSFEPLDQPRTSDALGSPPPPKQR